MMIIVMPVITARRIGIGLRGEPAFDVRDFAFGSEQAAGEEFFGGGFVRGSVKDHGGRIEIESQVGRGTTFTIILPVEGAPERKTND